MVCNPGRSVLCGAMSRSDERMGETKKVDRGGRTGNASRAGRSVEEGRAGEARRAGQDDRQENT